MKKRLLLLLLSLMLVFPLLTAPGIMAASVNDYPVVFTTFNTAAVRNDPDSYPKFTVSGGSDLLVQSVTTYHWNDGLGSAPGTISIYDAENRLVGSWNASGRSGSAANQYWDVFPNVVLKAGKTYSIEDSEPQTWSCNSQSGNAGFAEVRGTASGIPTKQPSGISVTVNGAGVQWTDAVPFINSDSRTMVPLRAVAEALGLTVDWNGTTREAIFTDGTKTIYFPIDSKVAYSDGGGTVTMDTAAVIVNSRTYAPIRYLAEFFGFTVGWDGTTRTVGITGGTGGTSSSGSGWELIYENTTQRPNEVSGMYSDAYAWEKDTVHNLMCHTHVRIADGQPYQKTVMELTCTLPPKYGAPGEKITFDIAAVLIETNIAKYYFGDSCSVQYGLPGKAIGIAGHYLSNILDEGSESPSHPDSPGAGTGGDTTNPGGSCTVFWHFPSSPQKGDKFSFYFMSFGVETEWCYEYKG